MLTKLKLVVFVAGLICAAALFPDMALAGCKGCENRCGQKNPPTSDQYKACMIHCETKGGCYQGNLKPRPGAIDRPAPQ